MKKYKWILTDLIGISSIFTPTTIIFSTLYSISNKKLNKKVNDFDQTKKDFKNKENEIIKLKETLDEKENYVKELKINFEKSKDEIRKLEEEREDTVLDLPNYNDNSNFYSQLKTNTIDLLRILFHLTNDTVAEFSLENNHYLRYGNLMKIVKKYECINQSDKILTNLNRPFEKINLIISNEIKLVKNKNNPLDEKNKSKIQNLGSIISKIKELLLIDTSKLIDISTLINILELIGTLKSTDELKLIDESKTMEVLKLINESKIINTIKLKNESELIDESKIMEVLELINESKKLINESKIMNIIKLKNESEWIDESKKIDIAKFKNVLELINILKSKITADFINSLKRIDKSKIINEIQFAKEHNIFWKIASLTEFFKEYVRHMDSLQ